MPPMQRGANVALTQEIPGLTGIVLGVAWNTGAEPVLEENLVLAAVLCNAQGRAPSAEHLVFFNQLSSPEESVTSVEQALAGDKEQIEIDLPDVPADITRIVAVVYVNEGTTQRRSLGQLREITVVVREAGSARELIRSENLAPGLDTETALVLGEVYRHSGDWKFKVIGDGYTAGIAGVAGDYGLPL